MIFTSEGIYSIEVIALFKKIWVGILSALGLLILIFDNKNAFLGATDGVDLCIRSVIPSLFPILYLSGLITGTLSLAGGNSGHKSGARRILLLTGYLGGYPVGAQSVVQAYRRGVITPQEIKRLLVCCNNPGPAFIFGIAASVFAESWVIWVLWGIHILSSVAVYWIIPADICEEHSCFLQDHPVHTSVFSETTRNMAQICGWIVLFRVFIYILEYRCLELFPKAWQIMICGLLELTNGCMSLEEISCLGLRFSMCAFFLSFGGCCTLTQTHSVTNGLHTGSYVLGKLLEGGCSFWLAYLVQFCLFRDTQRFEAPIPLLTAVTVFIVISILIIRKLKNSSRNPSMIGV